MCARVCGSVYYVSIVIHTSAPMCTFDIAAALSLCSRGERRISQRFLERCGLSKRLEMQKSGISHTAKVIIGKWLINFAKDESLRNSHRALVTFARSLAGEKIGREATEPSW